MKVFLREFELKSPARFPVSLQVMFESTDELEVSEIHRIFDLFKTGKPVNVTIQQIEDAALPGFRAVPHDDPIGMVTNIPPGAVTLRARPAKRKRQTPKDREGK